MKTKKHQINLYAFHDFTGLTAHLEKMALRGWEVERITDSLLTFRPMPPCPRRFSIVYLRDGVDAERYLDFCAEAGWRQAVTWAQMRILCTDDPDTVPVDTDEDIHLDNIRRVMDRFYIDHLKNALVISLAMAALLIFWFLREPLEYLLQGAYAAIVVCWVQSLLTLAAQYTAYRLWLQKSRKEGLQPSGDHRWIRAAGLTLVVLAALGWLCTMGTGLHQASTVMILGTYILIQAAQKLIAAHMRRRGSPPEHINHATWIIQAVGWTGCTLLALVFFALSYQFNLFHDNAITYEYNGRTMTQYQDEMPLYIEDLTPTDYGDYSTLLETRGSPLLRLTAGEQTMKAGDEGHRELRYWIYDVHFPPLTELMTELLTQEHSPEWIAMDADGNYIDTGTIDASFRPLDIPGLQAYQMYLMDDVPSALWLLCGETRFVILSPDWELTHAQLAIAAEKLSVP